MTRNGVSGLLEAFRCAPVIGRLMRLREKREKGRNKFGGSKMKGRTLRSKKSRNSGVGGRPTDLIDSRFDRC
jgi:hypothetical protein